jgi:hypothetical protein
MSDRTANIELRDINPRQLEDGIVPAAAGPTTIGSATIVMPNGGANERVPGADVNRRILQLLRNNNSTQRLRKINMVLVIGLLMTVLTFFGFFFYFFT